ncbi:MAG: Gfo/Idh/MocA family oxidoreductase [Lachnospiraceae bacterium]|nr:Gfo/Idh/MocA family oxidoreductase [Lachnospiraceae bacterium]
MNNRIVAVWNRSFDKAEAFAKKYGGKTYHTVEEAINAPEVECVYIALTADVHAQYVRKCIENHKPVLCEKPFAVNAEEAEELYALAEKEGVYLAEAMWTWHNDVALKVREWVLSGRIGKVTNVECVYAFPMSRQKDTRLLDPKRLGGALLDIGVYGLRYCLELFGEPKKIECKGRVERGVDLGEDVVLYYEDFKAHCTFAIDKMKGESFTISGVEGKIQVPYFHTAWKGELRGKEREKIRASLNGLYGKQFSNVAKEIRDGLTQSRFITPQNTLICMRMMDECRSQMGLVYPCEMEKEPEIKVSRCISHLGFNCKDLERSVAFYRDILGCSEAFTMTYGDMIDDIRKKAAEKGEKVPFYVTPMEKMRNKKWSVYMRWSDNTFIELFYIPRARRSRVPNPADDLNYTHYSLEVSDLQAFKRQVLKRGGAPYIDRDIAMGMDNTWVMWMHDPDGNPFEVMEYTDRSYQVVGR